MARSSNSERVRRINAASVLLKKHMSTSKAAIALAEQYAISKRQAYRYVQEADSAGKQMPVPDQKSVFTVKLSIELVRNIREHANSTGQTISDVVTQALESFFYKGSKRG